MPATSPDDRPAPDAAPRPRLRRVALAAAVAWLLLAVASLAVGDAVGIVASGAVLVPTVAAVALARWRPFRLASAAAIGAYLAFLTAATLVAGRTPGSGDGARIAVFVGNPNVLGAALVTAMAAWAAVSPGRRWVWWAWPLVALAVLNTGSRTSGGALLAAGAAWLVLLALRLPRRRLLAPLVALLVVAAAAFAWQRGVVELTPNLLAAPSDLTHPAWSALGERVEVVDDAVAGPIEGTRAQRLVGNTAPRGRNVLVQSIGRSETGVPYVASVYLRADTPQRLQLSSHLASVTCEVDATWRRCVTPVGYGDDYRQRQLHLRAVERGGSFDVYVFGAQYERGEAATPFLDLRPAWVPQSMVNRYDLRRITFLPVDRVAIWRAGLAIARESPWFGVGLAAADDAFRGRTREVLSNGGVTYGHNLLVQLVAVHGVVGLLAAALFLGTLLSTLSSAGLARLAPLLLALVLLNTWDLTLFEPFVFAPAVLAVASWSVGQGRPSEPRGGGAPGSPGDAGPPGASGGPGVSAGGGGSTGSGLGPSPAAAPASLPRGSASWYATPPTSTANACTRSASNSSRSMPATRTRPSTTTSSASVVPSARSSVSRAGPMKSSRRRSSNDAPATTRPTPTMTPRLSVTRRSASAPVSATATASGASAAAAHANARAVSHTMRTVRT